MTVPGASTEPRGARAMRIGTIAVAVVLIGVSIAVVIGAQSFPGPTTLGAPGPARMPILYAVALAALSLGLIGSAFMGGPQPELHVHRKLQLVALAAWTALYIWLLPQFGFLWVTVPWLLVATRFLGAGWFGSFLTAAILPAAVFLSFGSLLGVPLP